MRINGFNPIESIGMTIQDLEVLYYSFKAIVFTNLENKTYIVIDNCEGTIIHKIKNLKEDGNENQR